MIHHDLDRQRNLTSCCYVTHYTSSINVVKIRQQLFELSWYLGGIQQLPAGRDCQVIPGKHIDL